MLDPPKFSNNAFDDWPAFRDELAAFLRLTLDAEAVERVMARTRDSYSRLQFAAMTSAFQAEHAEELRRFEEFHTDFKVVQMRLLSILIGSFISLEMPHQ